MSGTFITADQHTEAVFKLRDRIAELEAEVKGKTSAIHEMKTLLKEREKYWRDWNGRAANRAAKLEAENDRLLVLATKWCDKSHHDWEEILKFAAMELNNEVENE